MIAKMSDDRATKQALWHELADLSIVLAGQAGEKMQLSRGQGLSVSSKSSSTDLVTNADRAVEQMLVDEIRRLRPGDAIHAEEGSGDGSAVRPVRTVDDQAVRWVIDPIDGTVNFLLGLPHYSVSIAAQVNGQTVAAAVLNPVSGDLFRARRGGGAFCNDQPLAGPRRIPLAEAVVATGFSYDRSWRAHQGRVIAALLPRVANLRRCGSAALDLCSVAAGWVDMYFECPTNEWDYAAGVLIAEEAGVVVSGLHGRPPGPWMVAAAPCETAEAFFGLLIELDAEYPG